MYIFCFYPARCLPNIYNKHLNLVDVFHIPQAVGEGNHSIESWYSVLKRREKQYYLRKGKNDDLLPKDSRLTEQTQVSAPRTSLHAAAAKSLQSLSDSVRPHRRQPTRLHRPWDFPGKNTGVGCHFLLQCMKVKSEREVIQLCSDSSRPHGLHPTRLLRP